ncbi:MAG: response regulator transcription factor [Anaerolineae bacterium]
MTSVLIVDDHQLFLEAMRDLLTARGLDVVGLAYDGVEALAQTRALQPDVILMDIQMPRCSGLEATRCIKAEFPDKPIVILSSSDDDDDLFEAIKSGASGYLLKSMGGRQFFELFQSAIQGEAPLAPGLARRLIKEFARQAQQIDGAASAPSDAELDTLSDQELDILKYVARGRTYKEIGQTLYLSERTVKYHMSKILKRLHLRNREQVVAYAAQRGLLSDS